MTLVAQQQEKHCFAACSEDKVNAGQCDCINRMSNSSLRFEVMFSQPDVRNKLSPIVNLIAMLENGLVKGDILMHDLVIQEIEQCKKSIAYLSGNQ